MSIKPSVFFTVAVGLVSLVLAGCVSLGGTQGASAAAMDEASLRARVEQEWEARVKSNWSALYDMTTTEYRKNNPREGFGAKSTIRPKSYSIVSVSVNAPDKSGVAEVKHVVTHMGFNFPFTMKENWKWEDDNWYLVIQ